jgi:hypothetical protein
MTAVRKVIDSNTLENIFDLPPDLKNKKLEILMFPVDESDSKKNISSFSMAQIEEWANAPEIQSLVGVLNKKNLPKNINMNDIHNERLMEKYKT